MQKDPIDSAIDELAADIEKAVSMLQHEDSQFHRRVYVRALFAYFEGITYWIRQNAIEIDKLILKRGGTIDWERHTLLYEDIPIIADNGKIEKQKQKGSFKNRFAFSVRAFSEIVQCKENVFDQGWQQLLTAVKIRDRLMHPKQGNDVLVSDEDVQACREGYTWFAHLVATKFIYYAQAMIKESQ